MSVYQSNLLAMMDPSMGYNLNSRAGFGVGLGNAAGKLEARKYKDTHALRLEELARQKENDAYTKKYGLYNQGKGTPEERLGFLGEQGFSSEASYRDPDTGFNYYGAEAKAKKDPNANLQQLQSMMGMYNELEPYSWNKRGGWGLPEYGNPKYDQNLAGIRGKLSGRMSKLSGRI